MPQLDAQLPTMIAVPQSMQATMKGMHSTFPGLINQIDRMTDTASAMGPRPRRLSRFSAVSGDYDVGS